MLSRRTFVTLTASLPLLGSKLWAAVSSNSNPSRSPLVIAPETGLLERTAGCDVARQMDYASSLGFRGFSVCNLLWVSESERETWLTAADQHQLRLAPPRITISAVSDPVGKSWDQSFERQVVQVANWGLRGLRLADLPGGGAPGTGQLPLGQLLRSLMQHSYAGVLALRHGSGGSDGASDQRIVRACEILLSEVAALTGSSGFPRTA